MHYKEAYDKAIEVLNRDTAFLFQRLNFFLVTTAFLLAAFGTVIGVGGSNRLIKIDYVIGAAGLILSLIFASINFLITRIILRIFDYICELERAKPGELINEDRDKPYSRINEIASISMNRGNIISLFWDTIWGVLILIFRPRNAVSRGRADHTYIIPLGFALIWICLIGMIIYLTYDP